MYFCLHKMSIDAIIMNRILPKDIKDQYFEDWKKIQKQHIQMAEEYFSPIPIFMVHLFKGEIVGLSQLKGLSEQIYEGKNPQDRFFREDPYILTKENGEYQMMIKLPFIQKADVELNKISDELVIRVGSLKRNLLLPRSVAAAKSIAAKYEDPYLKIFFKGDHHG